ncbi:MAG TPA: histidine kinase [Syntrophorhabdaceae bacterium]|nr:histidine kinase [Syntrophorhabdaceae bacterium]
MEKIIVHHDAKHVLMDLLYTVIICFIIAGLLTVTGENPFRVNLVMSLCFGFSVCLTTMLMLEIFKPERRATLFFVFAIGITVGMTIGLVIGAFALNRLYSITLKVPDKDLVATIVSAITITSVVAYFFYSKARLKSTRRIIEEERVNRLLSEKEALEARLRLLQAQIEPHFLFNTLSNVLSLVDTDPAKGKSMLTDLIRYLRTSLSRTLPETTTLSQEMEMIRSYLNIQKIRMDERLSFTIEFPDALGQQPFPPMLIQPIVENAIKHGLEPTIDGGTVAVRATKQDGRIRIEVVDTGMGFSAYQKNGVGIANVKERLKLLFGENGRFTLEENKPTGVRAVIEVPEHDV